MKKDSLIERIAVKLKIIPDLSRREINLKNHGILRKYPSPENWHNHTELDAQAWPKRIEK